MKTPRKSPEADLQEAIVNYCKLQYPKVTILHIPNEGLRGFKAQRELKRNGTLKGVADLFIPRAKFIDLPVHIIYHGLWIEVKSPFGKPTPEQRDFLNNMENEGYKTAIVNNLDDAMKIIDKYLK